jgi:sensor histidine kinase YesM
MEHTNIGICNVEEIIRLEYGDEYGLNIESEPGKGTVVTYVLPVLRKEGEHDSDNNSGR